MTSAESSDRPQLLAEIYAAKALVDEVSFQSIGGTGVKDEAYEDAFEQLSSLQNAYRASLPEVLLSRCPFTGEYFVPFFDPYGLDGPWWDYDNPIRPYKDPLKTMLAFTGSLKPGAQVESFPFLCKPGPEVPYVLTYLIEAPQITAVLSSVKIGPHLGYPIVYYCREKYPDLALPNDWGASYRFLISGDGDLREIQTCDMPEDYDFELEKHIRSGKLLWMAPDDSSGALHRGLEGCPYLNLEGRRSILYISRGAVETEESMPHIEAQPEAAPAEPGPPDAAIPPAGPPPTPSPAKPEPVQWYYSQEGAQAGPVAEDDLRAMIRQGRLRPDVYVWNEGLKEWQQASAAGLVEPAAAEPPPAPPVPETGAAPAAAVACPQCGASNRSGARFCQKCGSTMAAPPSEPACPSCGKPVKPGARFCMACGGKLPG